MNKLFTGYTWVLLLFLIGMSNPVLAQLKILDDGDTAPINNGDTIVVCQGSRNTLEAPGIVVVTHRWLFDGAAPNQIGILFPVVARTFNTLGTFNASVSGLNIISGPIYAYNYTIVVVEPPAPVLPMDTTICVAQPLSLITGNITADDSLRWEEPVRATNRFDSAWVFTPWSPGTYDYELYVYKREDIGGIIYSLCEEDYEVEATVVADGPPLNIMTMPTAPCRREPLELRVNLMHTRTYNIEWALDSLFDEVFRFRAGVTGLYWDTVMVRQLQAKEYFVRVTDLGNMNCPGIGRVWVPMSTNPQAMSPVISANRDTFYLGDTMKLRNLNPQPGGTAWRTPASGGATGSNYNQIISNINEAGIYRALSRGLPSECPSEPDSTYITVLPFFPITVNVSVPTAICAGDVTALGVNVTGGAMPYDIYVATDPGFTNIVSTNTGVWSPTTTVSLMPLTTTNYYIRVVDVNSVVQNITITILVNPAVSVSIDSLLYSPCPSEPFQLQASVTGGTPNFSFTWARNASFSPALGSTIAQQWDSRPIAAGGHDYHVRVTDMNGCSATAMRNIDVLPNPAQPNILGDSTLCADGVLQLNPQTPVWAPIPDYEWLTPAGDVLSPDVLTIPSDSSDYQRGRWLLVAKGPAVCHDTFSLDVEIDSFPIIPIWGAPTGAICPTAVGLWVGGSFPNVSSYSWLNRAGDTLGLGGSLNLVEVNRDSAVFLQVKTTAFCTYLVDSALIDVLPVAPYPNLYARTDTVYVGDTLNLFNLNPFSYGTQFNRPLPSPSPPQPAPGPDSLQVIFYSTGQTGWYKAVNRGLSGTWCDSPADSIEITVFPTLAPLISGGGILPVCPNTRVTLSAGGTGGLAPYNFTWSTDPTFSTNTTTGQILDVFPSVTTTYYLRVGDSNGRSATTSVTIQVYPQMSATITSNPSPTCRNRPFDLTINMTQGTSPYSYVWSLNNTVFVPTGNNTGPTYRDSILNNRTYYVRVTDANSCDTVFSYQQIIAPTASLTGINGDSLVCHGDNINLTAVSSIAGTTVEWLSPTGNTYLSNNINIPSNSPHYRAGIWRLLVQYPGFCDTVAFLNVRIDSVPSGPIANLPVSLRVCRRGGIVLRVDPSLLPLTNVTFANMIWRDRGGAVLGSGPTLNVQNIRRDTTVFLEFTTNQGCVFTVDSATVLMVTGPAPPMQIADSTQCEGDTLRFTSGPPVMGLVYYWVSPNGAVDSVSGNRFDVNNVTTADSGQYLLYVRRFQGCPSDTATLNVAVNALPNKPLILSTDTLFCNNEPIELIGSTSGCTNSYWQRNANLPIGTLNNPDTLRIPPGTTGYGNGTWRLYCENNITTCVQASDPVNVRIATPPAGRPRLVGPSIACAGSTVTVRRGQPGLPLRWSVDELGQNLVFGVDSLVFTNLRHDTIVYAQFWDPVTGCVSLPTLDTLEVYPVTPTPQVPPSIDLCQGDNLVLTATQRPLTNYRWFLVGGTFMRQGNSISIAPSNLIAYQSGVFGVYATDSINGCVSDTAYVQVTINAAPVEPVLPLFSLVCPSDSLILSPTNSSATCDSVQWYSWFVPRDSTNDATLTVAPGDSQRFVLGLWIMECIDANTGCSSFSNWSFVFTPNYLNSVVPLASPSVVCVGEDVQLTIDSTTFAYDTAFTYEWRDRNGVLIDTGYYTAIAPDVQVGDSIFLFITGPTGCASNPIPVPLIILTPEPAPDLVGNSTYCEGQPISLTTPDTRTPYYWDSNNGWSDVTSLGATTVTVAATVLDSGQYTLSVLGSNGCPTLADTLNIQVFPVPTAPFIDSVVVCDGEPIVWTATGASCGQYIWFSSIGTTVITTTNTLTIPVGAADYNDVVTWTVDCVDTTTNCSAFSLSSLPARIVQPPLSGTLSLNNTAANGNVCWGGTAFVSVALPTTTTNVTVAWYTGPLRNQLLGQGNTVQWANLQNDTTIYIVVTDTITRCETMDSLRISVNAPVPLPTITGDSVLCVNDVLSLSVVGQYSSYSWTGPNGFVNLNQSWSLIADTILYDGVYTVQVTDSLGCVSGPSTRRVIVQPTPSLRAVTLTPSVCEGDVLTLSAVPFNASYNYEWYRLAAGPTPIQVGNNAIVTFNPVQRTDGGRYYVKAELNGCLGYSDTIQINVDTPSTVYLADAGGDTTLCGVDSILLNALGGFPASITGTWTSSSTAVTLQQRTRLRALGSNLPAGTTMFYWSLSEGSCIDYSIDSILVTSFPVSAVRADAGPDQFLCDERVAVLGALNSISGGRWRQSPNQASQGISINDASDPNTAVQGLQPGNSYTFIWDLAAGPCRSASSDTVQLFIDTVPNTVADAGPDQQICDVNNAVLSAVLPSNTVGSWTTSSSAFIQLPDSAVTGVFDLRPGATAFVWSLSSGACVDYDRDTVLIFFGQGLINARPDYVNAPTGTALVPIFDNDQVPPVWTYTLTQVPSELQVIDLGTGVLEVNVDDGVIQTQFVYEVCDSVCPNNCDTALVLITVDAALACAIPNIFTPNGDGVNDLFEIPCIPAQTNLRIQIFNRWGDTVYETDQYDNRWDGTHQGKPLPDGTYFYVLFRAGQEGQQGSIEIKR